MHPALSYDSAGRFNKDIKRIIHGLETSVSISSFSLLLK